MGIQPERLTITLTNYGRKVEIVAKRGKLPKVSKDGRRITINFPENVRHKPKR